MTLTLSTEQRDLQKQRLQTDFINELSWHALNKQIWCVTDSDAPWNWLLIKDQGEEDKASDPIRKSAWVVFCFNARFIFEFYCSLLSNNNSYTSLSKTCVTQSLL